MKLASSNDRHAAGLHPEVAATPAWVIYKVVSPTRSSGVLWAEGSSERERPDACRIYVSVREGDWIEAWSADATGPLEPYVAVDALLDPGPTPAIYHYYVKLELQGHASINDVYLETDVQMAATSLPSLSVGTNRVVYRDQSPGPRQVRIIHGWNESSLTRPPRAPARPVAPTPSSRIDPASSRKLVWEAAVDPDSDSIADYHVQVSPRADMLHAVSPNLDRIISSGKPEWELPHGWLEPGRTYYWRVRAVDAHGGVERLEPGVEFHDRRVVRLAARWRSGKRYFP